MCYFSNKKLGIFARKEDQIWIFHDLLSARQHSQKNNEKKPLALIVMIIQYTKNLQLNFITQCNDIDNFKILQLLPYSKDFKKCQNSSFKLCQNQQLSPKTLRNFRG